MKTLVYFIMLACVLFPYSNVHAGLLVGSSEREERSNDTWLLTYYVGYHNGYLKPHDIDYSLMTHIVVGGVGVNSDGTLDEHWHLQSGNGRDMALDVGARADKHGVKKLIWLGGPNEEDKFYSATSDTYLDDFVDNVIEFINELDYDGVDIDWEPIRKQDEARVLALVRELREKDEDMIITIPVNWVPSSILFTKDLTLYKKLARYVDKMFIMSYSMAGPWPGWQSWHSGALGGDSATTPGSVRSSVYAYRKVGVPKEKLGIGIGTYATCWEYPVHTVRETLPSTFYPRDVHTMSMRTMMDDYYTKKHEKWDTVAQSPYLSFRNKKGEFGCGFISYENEKSVKAKVSYTIRRGLGGVMVWNIGTGYFPEERRTSRHELLKTAWDALKNK